MFSFPESLAFLLPAGWKRLPEQSRSRDLQMRHFAYLDMTNLKGLFNKISIGLVVTVRERKVWLSGAMRD